MTRLHLRIRALLADRSMTQVELARRCGVHKTAVNHWVKGKSAPRAAMIKKVAKAFECSVSELYGEAA